MPCAAILTSITLSVLFLVGKVLKRAKRGQTLEAGRTERRQIGRIVQIQLRALFPLGQDAALQPAFSGRALSQTGLASQSCYSVVQWLLAAAMSIMSKQARELKDSMESPDRCGLVTF